jgi:tetratricopeptide (TPR) repeat protein
VWYLSGRQELATGKPELAWDSWRESLNRGDDHIVVIFDQAKRYLTPSEILEKVMPSKAKILYEAAMLLHPEEDEREDRGPFLRRGLKVLAEQEKIEPEDYFYQALIYNELGQKKEAVEAAAIAVHRSPTEIDWRMEYARLLSEDGQTKQATSELRIVLVQDPNRSEAKKLLDMLQRRLLEEREH